MRFVSLRLKAGASMVCLMGVFATLLIVAGGAQAASTTTLSFLAPVEQRSGWDPVIEGFNRTYAKSNVKVEPSYVPGSSFGPLLQTRLQARSEPDLFPTVLGAGAAYGVWRLAGQGRLLDLSRGSWVKDIPKFVASYVQYKGRTFGYQVGYSPSGVLYNRSLFKSMKLKVPTRFGQLLSMCRQIARAGKIPIAFGAAGINASISLITMQAGNNVYTDTPNWSLLRERGKVKFANSPQWRRALQGIVDMKNANCFGPSPAAVTPPQQYAMMASGQSVLMIGVSSDVSNVKLINPQVPLAMFPLPASKAAKTRAWLAGAGAALVAKADTSHAFAARQFINYVARPDPTRLYNKMRSSLAAIDLVKGDLPSYLTSMKPLFKAGKVGLTFNSAFGNPSKGIFIPGLVGKIPGLFTGQESVQSILQFLDTTWDRP